MEDYKEKFQRLFKETSKAIRILRDVQQECTEAYVSALLEDLPDETNVQE